MVAIAHTAELLFETASYARGQDRTYVSHTSSLTNSASQANLRSTTYVGCVRLGTCSRDPIGYKGGINLYQYVDSKPLIERDPSGKDPWDTCSGYPTNGLCKKRSCLFWVKEVNDTYPENAKKCCEGFFSLYSHDVPWDGGREPDDAVVCVAECLIYAENSQCQNQIDCEGRSKCRHEAHIACYAQCGFIPYKGMPWTCLSIAPVVIGL